LPGEGLVLEHLDEVLPAPHPWHQARLPEDLGRALEAGAHHPQKGEDERDRHHQQGDRPADTVEDPQLSRCQRHCPASFRRRASWMMVRIITATNMIIASAEA